MKRIAMALGLGVVVAMGAAPAFAQYTGGGNKELPKAQETMDPTALYKQAVDYIQKKDYTRAVSVLRDVLDRRAQDPAANLMMGVAQIGLNDLPEAKLYLV